MKITIREPGSALTHYIAMMLAMFGANLLKLRPTLQLIDGKIVPTEKYRGKMSAVIKSYVQDMEEDLKNGTAVVVSDRNIDTETKNEGKTVDFVFIFSSFNSI